MISFQASGQVPQCTKEQQTKLQQIYQKHKQSNGQTSKTIGNEIENVFNQDQKQKFASLREKIGKENGFSQFFQKENIKGWTKNLAMLKARIK